MTETLCSCCKLLGKPPARINFILATGQPNSLVYPRIRHILRTYSETSTSDDDAHLTNYEVLKNISTQLFDRQNESSYIEQPTPVITDKCCHGFTVLSHMITDISDSSQLDTFQNIIRDKLDPKIDQTIEETDIKSESKSWIMIGGSVCLEPELLNVFLRLKDENSSLLPFSLTILRFLVNEEQLFRNWFFQDLPIEDYQSNTYPGYKHQTDKFFSLLNSSKYLQQNTLLINEDDVSTNDKLQILLQDIFRNESSIYRATDANLRHAMAKLLVWRRRTMRDVRSLRKNLQGYYNPNVKNRLKPLLSNLKQTTTASAIVAAREVTHLVLDEFIRMNDEEKRVYRRQLMLGFNGNEAEHSNTITAQLVHYALYLIKNDAHGSIPLLYSIILTLCKLGTHFIFRHQLFNNTPEIYTLSLLLIDQRQYVLTLSGLRLCATILDGDQIEHKYALAYWKHDASSARKILDAIKWLLSPYITLKKLWKEEDEKKPDDDQDSESNDEESTLYMTERFCFRHASILAERSYIRNLASLFYGSTDHCAQVTEDDVNSLLDVIDALIDRRMASRYTVDGKSRYSVILLSEICTLLKPIFLYGSPSVHLALLQNDCLSIAIPLAIRLLLATRNTSKDMIDACAQLYIQFIQSKCKQPESVSETQNKEQIEQSDVKTTDQSNTNPPVPLEPSPNLISSYFDLYRQIRQMFALDKKSEQEEQIRKLLEEEWTKLNTVQLQHDYEQLKREQVSLKDELLQLREELQRTRSEKDDFRKENIRLSQEIDRLKRTPVTTSSVIAESQPIANITSAGIGHEKNTIDDLANLSPHEISPTQAEQCIREIYRRRTTFNDPDMRKSICGSLKHLGSDLYSSPVHFLHELIQVNAEDNFYDDSATPCLRIELDHSYILLSNNEKGLRTQDVLAICSLAVSTKSLEQKQIGEKGVGFKSVFAASNQPTLISHAWRFRFLVPGLDAMSYITPFWLADQDIPDCISSQISTHSQDTHLYLPLKLQAHMSEAELFLDQVTTAADPCILLNMRHLKKLEIIDRRQNKVTLIEKQLIGSTKLEERANVTFEDFSFIDLTGSIIKLCTSSKFNTFRVYTCYIDVPTSIEQRRSPRTRLILAFPCESDYCLTSTVYTGLPVCDLGFNFLFNADFQLVTNRESVRENVLFNKLIRDHLAALFVYLILNDTDLTKEIHRYFPSKNIHQLKHSSWWLTMIDDIDTLITKYLPVLFDIRAGKVIRHPNKELALLVSKEQLYDCANIQVIDAHTSFLTAERLKSFQIQSVSILDILHCFPNREETLATNTSRQEFRSWAQNQDKQWWSQLFHHISQTMTPTVFNTMLEKPVFLLNNDHQRQYLPTTDGRSLLLFLSDDSSFRMWKRQLTLLQYASEFERTALLKSDHVQLLTDERMIEIIRQDHLQLANTSSNTNLNLKLIVEIWKDLFYLKSRVGKVQKSTPFLVPVDGTPNWTIIQEAIVPTILAVDIRPLMCSTISPIIHFPYYDTDRHQLIEILQWEHFLLEMNCQRPSIYLPQNYTITKLPLLPSFAKFTDEKCARMGESILSAHTHNTKECLHQFPIIDDSKDQSQICSVSTAFDETIVHDLASLPRLAIPSYCRTLAINLGVCVEYDLRTCVTILQLLSNEKNTNIHLYVEWLGHLQLYIRQQKDFDSQSLLASCQLYLPDQKDFYALNDLLVVPDDEVHRNSILLVCKYLKLQWISPTNNQIYWQFKELFRLLGCACAIDINHIYNTIYRASQDKSHFFELGDCNTTLKESGMETMITLFEYLEDLILECVKDSPENQDLYRAVVEKKNSKAPCGSRDDLEWRFGFTCNSLSKQLKYLTGIQLQENKISLPTIDRQLILKTTENIVYGCLEMIIAQTLSKDTGKRHFILPTIARTCPLVLAIFEIDYVERRGKLKWIHLNNNLENQLFQLTEIFRDVTEDLELEVITARYARIALLLSDSFVIDSSDEQDENEIDEYSVDTDYPFWIFNKTVLLCVGYEKHDNTKAIIATSALTTLLHKRKYLTFEEAKSRAQQRVSRCAAFRSDNIAHVAGAESSIYSYTDLLFPADHHLVESMSISIGKYPTIEEDLEDERTNNEVATDRVAESRSAEDRVYRNRVQTQNHLSSNPNRTTNWTDSSIVDGEENIRIGRNAEHFFFTYLQQHYGTVDVTPTQNWRSSSRLIVYPQYRRHVNDAAGFDLELHDTREIFTRGSKSTTKTCYFEIKGTSGLYNEEHTRFHISQNELDMCQAIETNENRREREAYFIVIIQNCLDPEKISFGTVIDWSSDFNRVCGTVDSYQCKIVPPQPMNSQNPRREESTNRDNYPQQQQRHSNYGHNHPMAQSAPPNNYDSVSNSYAAPYHQNQQQQQQQQYVNSNNRYRGYTTRSAAANRGNSSFGHHNRPYDQNQQQGHIPGSNRRRYQ